MPLFSFMTEQQRWIHRLALVLSHCEWTQAGIVSRIIASLDAHQPKRWVTPMAKRLLTRFPSDRPPTRQELLEFLQTDPRQQRMLGTVRNPADSSLPWLSLLQLPAPIMQPGRNVQADWKLPALTTLGQLADWLALTSGELDWFRQRYRPHSGVLADRLLHYRYRWVRKRSGQLRLIEMPKSRLKQIQSRILTEILNPIPIHPAAYGFCRGRSVLSYVLPHVRQDVVMRFDLRDFFPNLSAGRVRSLFGWLGYPAAVAHALTGLTTNTVSASVLQSLPVDHLSGLRTTDEIPLQPSYRQRHVPQGAVTSPALSNLLAYRLDCRLSGLAAKTGLNYSRYADDLVFSGPQSSTRNLSPFRIWVGAIVLDEGFQFRHRKTSIARRGQRQLISGIVVNAKPNMRRSEYDRLHAILHNCVLHGPATQNREQHENFQAHLLGKISYASQINPHRGEKLRRLYEQIDWK